MDFNYVLLWVVFAFTLFSLVQLFRFRRKGNRLWILKNGFVFAVTLILLKIFPEQAGFVGAGFWFVFIFTPLTGMRLVNNLQLKAFYGWARVLCQFLWILHPDQNFKLNIILLQARLWVKQGKSKQALAYLEKYRQKHKLLYSLGTIYSCILTQRWRELLVWFKGMHINVTLLPFYSRALGEVGEVAELIKIPVVYRSLFERENYFIKNTIRLHVFAFSGAVREVEVLLDGALSGLSKEQKIYWRAVALQAGGEIKQAKKLFNLLMESKNILMRDAACHRLHCLQIELKKEFDLEIKELLEKAKADFIKEERFSLYKKVKRRGALITLIIIGINLVVFTCEELLGGSTNEMTLYKMGALYTLGFTISDVWRIITAQFLHYGFLHLAMNMLGLFILGPHVELFLGRIKYALVYFLSGIGALACYLLIAGFQGTYDFLVGASAGIMGVVGALFAMLLKGFFIYRISAVKNQLFMLSFFIGLQIIFDVSTPEVSFWGHFFGLIFGFLSTWILMLFMKEKNE
ncbi:MAG: rhomboid family intramembrane serine protease [Spirochaetales bacterium]|nr:rhomboid family intramembrane serine protease [Spirochaetales bacterium]